jgi:predicted protein tyrosine phosphatase
MPNIRPIDMMLVDDIFEMGSGYVLSFNDRTFAQFFADELQINIDDPRYEDQGTSKAKRLRCFLNKVDLATSVKALNALWELREAMRIRASRKEWVENAHEQFQALLHRMQGKPAPTAAPAKPATPVIDRTKLLAIKQQLIDLSTLQAQARGYAFEKWLQELFNFYGLNAREPFRLNGEQIDGSFLFQAETYLLEAKWQAAPTPAADLHVFQGKLEQKAVWARGLFVSNSGFTQEGLDAFGRGKRVVCMDGLDLYETLNREIPLTDVLERKVRRAAETGAPFSRVRDLFV